MADPLQNTFLKETTLTSTKNKFILQSSNVTDENLTLTYSEKRKLPSSYLASLTYQQCPLLSTENKYLIDDKFPPVKKKKIQFKKKKAERYRSSPRSAKCRARRAAPCSAPCGFPGKIDDFSLDMGFADEGDSPERGSPTLFGDVVPAVGYQHSVPTAKQNFPSSVAFAGPAVNSPMPQLSIPADCIGSSPVSFSFGQSESLFGSSPGMPAGSQLFMNAFAEPHSMQQMMRSAATFGSSKLRSIPSLVAKPLSNMPGYDFETSIVLKKEVYEKFSFVNSEAALLQVEKVKSVKYKKMQFLNVTSMALICKANLKRMDDSYRLLIQKHADDVRAFDPEFILKVALFARQELHIRSAANFLLSYAAFHEDTRIYLAKYFDSCVRLPSDWMEVAALYQVFEDARLKPKSLPSSLKKAMFKSFAKFDAYQLAKYNRVPTTKKKLVKENRKTQTNIEPSQEDCEKVLGYTLKQLIRLLHIDSPANEVMCLLGKKYPSTIEEFKNSKLPGTWDSRKAGKRMKLPVPETWETQISAHGNKPSVWEKLLDNSKLPYMAMLRNLKNLLLSGISQKHHKTVLKHLENKTAVLNSRQLPLQFFEAYKSINEIEDMKRRDNDNTTLDSDCPSNLPAWDVKRKEKNKQKLQNVSSSLLESYKKSISSALEISALYNLQPIPGKCLVICDVLFPDRIASTNQKKTFQLCVMMGLMCLKACEDCKMILTCGKFSQEITLHSDSAFLQSVLETCSTYEKLENYSQVSSSSASIKAALDYYLKEQTILKEKVDHLICLQVSGNSQYRVRDKEVIASFLHKYREIVNSELLYTDVDFFMTSFRPPSSDAGEDCKDVYLSGNTTQLIKFIAERSSGGQLSYVENIDIKYDLSSFSVAGKHKIQDVLPNQAPSILSRIPKWHTIRIFISSTFKDMHSERDLLIRYVLPELRRRAASVFVKINEVDLRWGITETDCASKRAAELCLLEAQRSDIFIGILGNRYGTIYDFEAPDAPELQWVKEYPPGLSITELEMHAGALREDKLQQKNAYFYIRDSSFMSFVPAKWKSFFSSENPESNEKVEALKSTILSSGLKVLDCYPCSFAGTFKDKPILSGMEKLGETVLSDLWHAVSEMHEKDPYMDEIVEEEANQQHLIDSSDFFIEAKDSPLKNVAKAIQKETGIFVISGAPGCGKTAFLTKLLKKLDTFVIVKLFIGLTPRSTNLSFILSYISNSISKLLPVSSNFPKLTSDVLNHFPDILQEAVNSSGCNDFALVLDGMDHLSEEDQFLDWLPLNLPQGLKFICTTSDTSYVFKALLDRKDCGTPVTVQPLFAMNQIERECIVRQYLKLYGKTLDESPFNNQMLLLVTKKDSGIPLYLRMACDYLRRYATFENFMSTLQNLPSTIPLLFQEIIIQMENEFGSTLIQIALTLLCITKEGVDDADFHLILSLVLLQKNKGAILPLCDYVKQLLKMNPDEALSQITYCSLVHTISNFAFGHNRVQKLSLVDSEFEESVKKYYLNKNYSNFSKSMHCILAAYYSTICDSKNDASWKGRSDSSFRGLIYHLFNGECYEELCACLCNFKFIEAAFSLGEGESLLEHYSLLIHESRSGRTESAKKIDYSLLLSFNDFVSRNTHIFQMYPELVLQQAVNEPPKSLVKQTVQSDACSTSIIQCITPNDCDLRIATLSGFFKNITAVSCQKDKSLALLGSEDGYLKVLDFASKKILRSIKGHSSMITFICFAGKNRICTASTDTTLSIWNSIDYSRIFVLKGHKHNVSCCCFDSTSDILLSSGWDNTVRLWSMHDGRSITVLENFRCPVNCLDYHPVKQEFVCGLWNGDVEVWDAVALKRINVLSSRCRSVKSVTYTPDGINIISSYMNSEVIVWSSEKGLKITSLKGHMLPVRCISYTYEGNKILSGSDDGTLKVWPTETGSSREVCASIRDMGQINLLEFITPSLLAVGFQNSVICVVDITGEGCVASKMTLEADKVSCFGKLSTSTSDILGNWIDVSLVFGTDSGKIMVANCREFNMSATSIGSIDARVTAVTYNNRIIVSASCDGDIGIFSYSEKTSEILRGVHRTSVTALSMCIRDEILWAMSTSSDKMVKLWTIDFEDLCVKLKEEAVSKHNDYVTCCCVLPFRKETNILKGWITGSHDNNVILEVTGLRTVFQGLKTSVLDVNLTDNYVLACGIDGSVAIWSKDGKLINYTSGVEMSSAVLGFCIEKDSSSEFDVTLAFVDRDGCLKIRKPVERSYTHSFNGHSKSITSCCSSEKGEILSCALDGTVNLWKLPVYTQDAQKLHTGTITDIRVSSSLEKSITSDSNGNVMLWYISASLKQGFICGKKTYVGGYVRALAWLKGKKFVCAVSQTRGDEDFYFLDIISFEEPENSEYPCPDERAFYVLEVILTHHLKSEIVCLDAAVETETIVAGLKSGEFVVFTPEKRQIYKLSLDWILGAKLFLDPSDSTEYLFISQINGSVMYLPISSVLKTKAIDHVKLALKAIKCSDTSDESRSSSYISAFCCVDRTVAYCGDSRGWLKRYSSSNPSSKKAHDAAITGVVQMGPYVFTSSLDRTLKGWTTEFKQVCHYHSSIPITCLTGCGFERLSDTSSMYWMLIGNSSGLCHLLEFTDVSDA